MNNQVIDDFLFNQLYDIGGVEFVKSIINVYYVQIEETLQKFDNLLRLRKFEELGELGHFLKGSSAQIGAFKIRNISEEIQLWKVGIVELENIESINDFFSKKIALLKTAYLETKKELDVRLSK
jgi:HPt (histidine-containing phosphotransfer) domain-containing protein